MVPGSRLIWVVALVGFPAAVMAGLSAGARTAAFAAIAIMAVFVIVDALLRGRALAGVGSATPPLVRFFRDRDGGIRVRVRISGGGARKIRVGLVAPEGIVAVSEDMTVSLPDGA